MMTIERIRRQAAQHPERTAYRFRGSTLTYGELLDRAGALAGALQARRCRTCVLYGGKEPEMPTAILGCLLGGVTYVPVSEATPKERLRRILLASGADCVISSRPPQSDLVPWLSLQELLSFGAGLSSAPEPFGPAYIIFTSGSTGEPKGVPISRENLDNFTDWITSIPELTGETVCRVLNQASFSFDLSVADLYYAFCGGHELVALDPALTADPAGLHEFWRNGSINVSVCTPTFLKLCLTDPEFDSRHLPDLRTVYSCGESLPSAVAAKLLQRFPELSLINAYGPTEATSAVCAVTITKQTTQQEILPAGEIASAACEIIIEDGEIVLKGRSVFSGYLGALNGGWYREKGRNCFRTGDLGEIRDGYLYCTGRKDRQIKWKGYRIELDEIEQTIDALPGVRSCAVIAKRSPTGEVRTVKAFVEPEENSLCITYVNGREEDLRSALAEKLPAYMLPKTIVFMEKLPVTPNGKLDRKILEEM